MTPDERDRMNSLCTRIQEEKDYRRFEDLLRELHEVIRQKEMRFPAHDDRFAQPPKRPWKTLSGVVQKIIKNAYASRTERVQIAIAEADDLFREIRIENSFKALDGSPVALKNGTRVDITLEADAKDTVQQEFDGHA